MTLRSNRSSLARKRWQESRKIFYELARVARPSGAPAAATGRQMAVETPGRQGTEGRLAGLVRHAPGSNGGPSPAPANSRAGVAHHGGAGVVTTRGRLGGDSS